MDLPPDDTARPTLVPVLATHGRRAIDVQDLVDDLVDRLEVAEILDLALPDDGQDEILLTR